MRRLILALILFVLSLLGGIAAVSGAHLHSADISGCHGCAQRIRF